MFCWVLCIFRSPHQGTELGKAQHFEQIIVIFSPLEKGFSLIDYNTKTFFPWQISPIANQKRTQL
jgi:hypothetical protein